MGESAYLTIDEIKALRESWSEIISTIGATEAGLAILHRLFTDEPDTLKLFYKLGVSSTPTIESLRSNSTVRSHAIRIASTVSAVFKNAEDKAKVIEMCAGLGKIHKKNEVDPKYFNVMGGVILAVVSGALGIKEDHCTYKAWAKFYELLRVTVQKEMSSEL